MKGNDCCVQRESASIQTYCNGSAVHSTRLNTDGAAVYP